MKRLIFFSLCVLFICSCSADIEPQTAETQAIAITEITTTQASSSLSTTREPTAANEKVGYIDENGYLNDIFLTRLREFESEFIDNKKGATIITLQDFDFDNIPEIVYTVHDGGQGLKESRVYRITDFYCYGNFKGFSRDGFTRFFNKYGGIIIHNYYEHSVSTRLDSYTYATIENEKLMLTEISCYSGEKTADNARIAGTKETNNELLEQLKAQSENTYDEIGFAATANEFLGEKDVVLAAIDYYNSCVRIKTLI